MKAAMRHEDGKAWFGAVPLDLLRRGLCPRFRVRSGADRIYTYLRSYRDGSRDRLEQRDFRTWACPTRCGNGRACVVPEERVAPVTDVDSAR